MKKLIMSVLFVAVLSLSSGVSLAYLINDAVGDKKGTAAFEIYGIDMITSNPNSLTFQIFTNYPQGGFNVSSMHTFAGDFAIDVNGDHSYEYGFALTTHDMVTAGSLYSVASWNTSDRYFGPGGYNINSASYNPGNIVTMNQASGIGAGTLNWATIGTDSAPPVYRIDITFDRSWINPSGDIGIYWASATCANDMISGNVNVPEPGTILLLGVGLTGLGFMARRRKK